MTPRGERATRREFVGGVGRLASVAILPASIAAVGMAPSKASPQAATNAEWDLSWLQLLAGATDRAVFDWPTMGDPADPMVFQLAARYLDNCEAVYAPGTYQARVVLNIRTQAVPVALNDQLWERYALGIEYKVNDPHTQQPAVRNPFWHRAPSTIPGYTVPTLEDFLKRGAFILVCDFSLGHLAQRLAPKSGRPVEAVHSDLRSGFVPSAYAVPSGIYGLARAQNAGCAYMKF